MTAAVAPPLVGRSDQLATLIGAVRDEQREVSMLLVGGDAGVGKSRLIEELTATLDPDDVTIVVGSCVHTAHSSLPFAAVTDAIARLSPHLDPD